MRDFKAKNPAEPLKLSLRFLFEELVEGTAEAPFPFLPRITVAERHLLIFTSLWKSGGVF